MNPAEARARRANYTPLAQKLAPKVGEGLVRRPRYDALIDDALIPALRERAAANDHDQALALLRQALSWLATIPEKSRARVSTDELLVPATGPGDRWQWVPAYTTYVGTGWLDDPNVELLTRAFGNRPGSQLIPWERFERRARSLFQESERDWWRERMMSVGVWDCPG